MLNFLKNFIHKEEKPLEKEGSFILESEPFDPKSAVVPGPVAEKTLEYFIFCLDPKASDDKHFMYYKRVFARARTKSEAEQIQHQIKSPYNHIIVTYEPLTGEVQGCPPSSVELVKTRIKEYFDHTHAAASNQALMEFAVIPKKD